MRERSELIAYDIFERPECRNRIFWSSTIPSQLWAAPGYPCYTVSLRVQDPGGKWSNTVTRVVKRCR